MGPTIDHQCRTEVDRRKGSASPALAASCDRVSACVRGHRLALVDRYIGRGVLDLGELRYVDRASRRPTPLPAPLRAVVEGWAG